MTNRYLDRMVVQLLSSGIGSRRRVPELAMHVSVIDVACGPCLACVVVRTLHVGIRIRSQCVAVVDLLCSAMVRS